ncbi:SigE family RNA polymerase sigma factor [Dactylosporangium vinaceum]|uniref:SigE family RNA polymerase sigma factor n=1 Tax=Dactylosporangium vinaceum TaxID=53362 RepID=A0ABV5MPZ7_9ACTN|nr:SigE family RNA polymerase sigma factor [Dactylosporangium vinaceum]UAB96610.1 SigE family RNA polymerase sigma factor [Dactylosporangium vinaceum]
MTFEEFVEARLQALLRYAVMLTGDPHTAQDLVQDTMIRAQLKWRRIAAADLPERYVKRMITNAYVDLHRGSWLRRVALRGVDLDTGGQEPDHADSLAERDEMWLWLDRLPRQQRAALVLRYYEGLSDGEIADVMSTKVGTVRSWISRALATLRTHLTPTVAGS